MSVSLYRKYRPQDFSSVVGQNSAVSILSNALTKGSAGHAYLFSGSRGCGKTSIARIFAKALNCLEPNGYEPCGHCKNCIDITAGESLDVIEIDGASNNGVENIRNIRSNVNLAPFTSKHKIYIIDEVHMLSQGAFNALLKTLEEPPEYVVFIMATTEPFKVPVTIRSRCQHIPFHSISTEDISKRLEYVCSSEGVKADTEALYEIARQADGALRDGLSLLEQVISAGDITLANVEALLGSGSRSAFERVVSAFRKDPSEGYFALKLMLDGGASTVRVFEELFSLVRNMWLISRWKGSIDGLGISKSERSFLADEVPQWTPDSLHYLLDRTLKALTKARQGLRTDILLGSFMLSLAKPPAALSAKMPDVPVSQIMPKFQPQVSSTPAIVPVPTKQEVTFDPELKAELLETAHNGDFVVYCALFDVRPFVENDTLILDVEHTYCYHRLLVSQNKAALRVMFPEFKKVVLRHKDLEDVECISPREIPPVPLPDYHTPQEQPAIEPVTSTSQEIIPSGSGIDFFRNAISQYVSFDILMRKHTDLQDNNTNIDTDNDNDEGDTDE